MCHSVITIWLQYMLYSKFICDIACDLLVCVYFIIHTLHVFVLYVLLNIQATSQLEKLTWKDKTRNTKQILVCLKYIL